MKKRFKIKCPCCGEITISKKQAETIVLFSDCKKGIVCQCPSCGKTFKVDAETVSYLRQKLLEYYGEMVYER